MLTLGYKLAAVYILGRKKTADQANQGVISDQSVILDLQGIAFPEDPPSYIPVVTTGHLTASN